MREKTEVDWQMKESQHGSPRWEKDYAVAMLSNWSSGWKKERRLFP